MNAATKSTPAAKTFTTDARGIARPTPIGLSPADQGDLTFFFSEFVGIVGLRSPTGAIAERLAADRAATEEANRRRREAEKERKLRLKNARDKAQKARPAQRYSVTAADLLDALGIDAPRADEETREPKVDVAPILTIDDLVTAWPSTSGRTLNYGDEEDRMVGLIDAGRRNDKNRGPLERATRVLERLRRMIDKPSGWRHVEVLRRLCGPRRAAADYATLGDVAPIATLTAAVAEARDALALAEGEARDERTAAAWDDNHPRLQRDTERRFWKAAGMPSQLRARAEASRAEALVAEAAGKGEARARLEASARWCETRAALLDDELPTTLAGLLYEYEIRAANYEQGRLSARLSAMASADREITAEDALRVRLAPAAPHLPKAARAAHDAARKAFAVEVRRQAERLRIAAAGAYREAAHAKPEAASADTAAKGRE